jgi:hypothetical protein
MRILSGYHFRDMHQVILNREKGTNTTSRTAHAVCIQIAACFVFAFPFENQICQGSSFWQSLDISGGWISNTFDDYHNVMVNLKNNIALMVDGQGKKQTKQVKHWVLPVYTIGPCFVLNFALEETFFCCKKTGAMRQRAFEHTKRPEVHGWIHHVWVRLPLNGCRFVRVILVQNHCELSCNWRYEHS